MGNLVYATLTQVLGRGGFMIASMLLARNLPLAEFSTYSYLILTANMIGSYASMGIGVVSARSFAGLKLRNQSAKEEIFALWLINIGMAIIITLSINLGLGQLIFSDSFVPMGLFTLIVIFSVFGIIPSGAIQGLAAFRSAAVIASISFVILLSSSLLASVKECLLIAILGLILSQCCKTIGEGIYAIKATGVKNLYTSISQFRVTLKRVVEPISSTALVSVLAGSSAWVAGSMLKRMSGEHEFALFSIGIQWYALVMFLPGVMTRVLFSRQVHLALLDDAEAKINKHKLLYQGVIRNIIVAALFAGIIAFLSGWIINLYGDDFFGHRNILYGYLAAGVVSSGLNMIGNTYIAEGKTKEWLFFTVLWLGIFILLCWLLMPFGALGTGVVYFIAASIFLVSTACYYVMKRRA